jgi:hypothetical protein
MNQKEMEKAIYGYLAGLGQEYSNDLKLTKAEEARWWEAHQVVMNRLLKMGDHDLTMAMYYPEELDTEDSWAIRHLGDKI